MDEEAGRPAFYLSFLSFAFTPSSQSRSPPDSDEPSEAPKIDSVASRNEKHAPSPQEGEPGVEHEASMDLAKHGPPDALMRLNGDVPPTVMAVIKDSIEHVRSQIAAETELVRRREERKMAPAEGGGLVAVDKGKGVEGVPAATVAAQVSSAAPDRTGTESFHNPSEGHTTSVDADARSEVVSVPPEAASAPVASPRRRDMLKAVFRKRRDEESRRRTARPFTGTSHLLELRATLKRAKQVLRHVDVSETV